MENIKLETLKQTLQNIANTEGFVMLKKEAEELLAGLVELEARKDNAYLERNRVVSALSKHYPSGVGKTAIDGWSEDWHGCVYIDLPQGQVSWHFHDSHAFLFNHLQPYQGVYDGHSTEEKYRRLAAFTNTPTPGQITDLKPIGVYRDIQMRGVSLMPNGTVEISAFAKREPVPLPKDQDNDAPSIKSRYNWKPDFPDHRDHMYERPPYRTTMVPAVDLSPKFPPPFDQGDLGSCTGNALAGQMAFLHPGNTFSRLFIYRGERGIEHTVSSDSGAQIRDGVKFLASSGCCLESEWPYDVSRFKALPPKKCFTDALPFKISEYLRLNTLDDMLHCLASGFPFVFGFTVYESFESSFVASTGVLNMPLSHEKMVGGHAVEAVGYDLHTRRFKVRNSWGTQWGQGGYFTIPFDYLTNRNLSDDFWMIRK